MYNKIERKDVRIGGPRLTHTYTYDPISQLEHTIVTDPIATPLRDEQYNLDGAGNRDSVLLGGMLYNYLLDPNWPIPGDFQMNQYTNTPFDDRWYDNNGNLTITSASGASTPVTSKYDVHDQLVEVNDTNSGIVITCSYDAFGRRIRKTTPSTDTLYFYDGWQVIEEKDSFGSTQAQNIFGNDIDEVLVRLRGGNEWFYQSDDLYNVMAITDSFGNVVERYDYGDFGEPNIILSSGIGNPYFFNGRRYDDETGLYYYRTRYLDPVAGRFTSRDSTGIRSDSANLGNASTYAGNNPWTATPDFAPVTVWFQLFEHDVSTYTGKASLSTVGGGDDKLTDLLREVQRQIPIHSPQWTDHKSHEPGITIIDLFSWMREPDREQLAKGILQQVGGGTDTENLPDELDLIVKTIRSRNRPITMEDYVDLSVLVPGVSKAPVTGVEMFKKTLNKIQAGDNVGVLLRGTARKDLERGQVFDSKVYVITKEEGGRHTPFFTNYRPQFYIRTTDVTGSVILDEGIEMVMPDDNLKISVPPVYRSLGGGGQYGLRKYLYPYRCDLDLLPIHPVVPRCCTPNRQIGIQKVTVRNLR